MSEPTEPQEPPKAAEESKTPNKGQEIAQQTMEHIKSFDPLTLVAAGLALAFLIFCFIDTLAIRWWVMIPVAAGSFFCARNRMQSAEGVELLVCKISMWSALGLFILRDMYMSSKFAELYDAINSSPFSGFLNQ